MKQNRRLPHFNELGQPHGVAAVGITNCNHVGMLWGWAKMVVDAGMIGLIMCSAGPRGGSMVPFGGTRPALAANPIAFGVPGNAMAPLISDFSTSVATGGKVLLALQNDQQGVSSSNTLFQGIDISTLRPQNDGRPNSPDKQLRDCEVRVQSRSVHPFSLLEYGPTQGRRQWGAFGVSIATHGLGLGLVVVLGLLFPSVIETVHQKPPPVYIDLVTPPKQQARAPMPPRPVWKMETPKLSLPPVQAPLAPPLRAVPRLEQPKVQAPVPPKVGVVFPSAPTPGDSRPHSPPPKVGVFEGSAAVATLKLPAREVQTGGFGSPNGLAGDAQGGNPGNVVKLGSFALPSGGGYGNGSGGTHGARGTVASAGFSNSIVSAGGGGNGQGEASRGVVRPSGFDPKPTAQTSVTHRRVPEKPSLVPVEILFKPDPVYTEAARKLGLQGEIVLSVIFTASGRLQVVRVVEGLGYGLDEAACRAAEAIRFKPARRDGKPVDFPATLRVVFQLAGSSSNSGELS